MVIERHEVGKIHFIERTRRKFWEGIEAGVPVIEKNPEELMGLADQAIRNACRSVFLGLDKGEVRKDLEIALHLGLTRFQVAAQKSRDFAIELGGRTYTLSDNGSTSYLRKVDWLQLICVAIILKKTDAAKRLIQFANSVFGAEVHDDGTNIGRIVTGFISLVEGTNVVLPELPIQSPRPVQLLQEPVLSCMHEIAQADVVGLQQVLIGALEKHKLFFDNDENRTEPLGWVSLMLSAITSISQDRGFDLKVKSDYLFAI
ncbi:MAG: immunity 49 family protein [Bacteroidetes bacterium]|nr:immunity 49 family protein [Bacteroidota bacterium]